MFVSNNITLKTFKIIYLLLFRNTNYPNTLFLNSKPKCFGAILRISDSNKYGYAAK